MVNTEWRKLLYNRFSMLNMECQVTFSVRMNLYYLCHFWLSGKGRPLCLKIVYSISVLLFLGAFAKLRKGTIYFMSVCRSVRTEHLGFHSKYINEICCFNVFFEELSRQLIPH
jgi:hypothetical protein